MQPTLMVSPRKEHSVKLPITIKPSQPKPTSSQTPNVQIEIQKKSQEGKTDAGKMLYYGPYSTKGLGAFQRSSSNEPYSLKSKTVTEGMGSPKKQTAGDTILTRKSPGLSDTRKSELLTQNIVAMSPSSQSSTKKITFGFLGLKFLGKK